MSLRKVGQGWKFLTEELLEDFIWNNLKFFWGLTPLKRQYFVKDEICDILAVDDNRKLVVLELKNSEVRYFIQQLTRYYDSLLEKQPLKSEIDYTKFVRLVVVAPTFHNHNFIDRKYSKLNFNFLQFEVLKREIFFYLCLRNTDGKQISELQIPYREIDAAIIGENIPAPPLMLLEWLGLYTSEQQEKLLEIRKQILNFDQRIEEIIDDKTIKYGQGRKLCAEFCFNKKLREVVLFLWLYIPNYRKRQAVGRMQIQTSDWSDYLVFGHVPKGISKMELGRIQLYYLVEEGERGRGYLDELVDEALETWLRRL